MNFNLIHIIEELPRLHIYLSGLISFILIFCLITWIAIAVSRTNKNRSDKRKKVLFHRLAETLMPHFYDDSEILIKEATRFARKYLKTREAKQFAVDALVEQTQNFLGDAYENTQLLYESMKLDKFSVKKLTSDRWFVICQGLNELGSFKNTKYKKKVEELLQHSHKTVQKVSLHTLVDISAGKEFPKDNIIQLDREISIWEQAILYENMHNMEKIQQWELSSLLDSRPSVFCFGIKVACLGNSSFLNNPEVLEKAPLMKDEEALIAFVDWLGRFGIGAPLQEMLYNRHRYSQRVQAHIIKQSYILPDAREVLIDIMDNESNYLAFIGARVFSENFDQTDLNLRNKSRANLMEISKNPLMHV